jgi:hypothetical protein
MGKRENKVEIYFNDAIETLGGFTRKWVSPGHSDVPDRIAFIPVTEKNAIIFFVEVKTANEEPTDSQIREIKRLQSIGANATWVSGHKEVDEFIKNLKPLIQQWQKQLNFE